MHIKTDFGQTTDVIVLERAPTRPWTGSKIGIPRVVDSHMVGIDQKINRFNFVHGYLLIVLGGSDVEKRDQRQSRKFRESRKS
jgi:hypothetical protein